ncbi:unnamed protein product [Ambrosiozyma monospora]|uniref:Unnamed protein product n=1 Tax=Ambrosiozyma monospora TaxID=43982 RepID=A0ACB5SXT8_AMBMO|nr:unnamed protein product [Ambrosiozyma monospora]
MEQFSLKYERRIFKYSHPREYYYIVSLVSQKTQVSVVKEPSNNHTVGVDMVGVVDDVVSVDVMNSLHDLGNVSTGVGVGVGVVVGAENEHDGDVNESGVGRPTIKGEWKSSPELVDSVWNMVASQPELFEEFYHSADNKYTSELNEFFNSLLNIEQDNFDANGNPVSTGVSTPAPIVGSLVKRLTYFNLPICQWLFKHTIEENVPSVEDEFDNRNKKVTEVVIELLDHLSERQRQDQTSESYLIGELFDQLSNTHKLMFLNACESLYLGSEKFPKFITNGKNLTKFLINMISSCSRLKDYNSAVMPMSDALVFSLNMSLEKLMYFCSNVEREKNKRDSMRTIETAIILLSRIILIHKSFLVELILERSVNVQRDVLILNLTKLFKNRIMEKNLKLKNLLYDVLVSIKLQISETIMNQQQPQSQPQQQQQPTQLHLQQPPLTHHGSSSSSSLNVQQQQQHTPQMMSLSKTPVNTSFMSPTNSPMPPTQAQFNNDGRNNSLVPGTPGLRNTSISGSSMVNRNSAVDRSRRGTVVGVGNMSGQFGGTRGGANGPSVGSATGARTTTIGGGAGGGLINISPPNFNNKLHFLLDQFDLVDQLPESNKRYFLIDSSGLSNSMVRFNLKKFEMIEDSAPTVGNNDSFVSLSYFDTFIEKKNPK